MQIILNHDRVTDFVLTSYIIQIVVLRKIINMTQNEVGKMFHWQNLYIFLLLCKINGTVSSIDFVIGTFYDTLIIIESSIITKRHCLSFIVQLLPLVFLFYLI